MVEQHSLRHGCVARFGMSLQQTGQVNQRQAVRDYDVSANQCPTQLLCTCVLLTVLCINVASASSKPFWTIIEGASLMRKMLGSLEWLQCIGSA